MVTEGNMARNSNQIWSSTGSWWTAEKQACTLSLALLHQLPSHKRALCPPGRHEHNRNVAVQYLHNMSWESCYGDTKYSKRYQRLNSVWYLAIMNTMLNKLQPFSMKQTSTMHILSPLGTWKNWMRIKYVVSKLVLPLEKIWGWLRKIFEV